MALNPGVSPERAREAATEILRTLRGRGFTAYFAGGSVRDELLGLEPTDYDVATDAVPEQIRSLFQRTAEVGVSFGVVLVRLGRVSVEVATFRSDGPYTDRRRPDAVTFSDPVSDAQRRDFTINALFLDPLAEPDREGIRGRVIDHVGGLGDLQARLIRAVGDPEARLSEDHLRALRAVRLASRLGFAIDPGTESAIRSHARELAGVSRERIGDELRRMLAHPSRARAAGRLQDLLLDEPVLDEPGRRAAVPVLGGLPADAGHEVALAAWALDRGWRADQGPEVARRWCRALCLSTAETDRLERSLVGVDRLRREWGKLGVAGRKRAAGSAWFADALGLVGAMDPALASRVGEQARELGETWGGISPEPLLKGDDLVAFGFEPGPGFRRMLDAAYDAQLEGKVRSREQALELVRRMGV